MGAARVVRRAPYHALGETSHASHVAQSKHARPAASEVFARFLKLAEEDLYKPDCTISELTAVQQKLIAATAEFTTQDAERRRVAEVELEKRYREREAELVKQYDEKRAELDKRGATLAEKEEDYLSRNAQLARREKQRRLEKLLTDLKDETVSDSTSAKRWWTFASILALVVVAGGLAFFTGWHLFRRMRSSGGSRCRLQARRSSCGPR